LGKHDPPQPIPAERKRAPMRSSKRDGGGQEAQGSRSGSLWDLRRARQTPRPRARLLRGREVAMVWPREHRLPARRTHRGVPRLLGFSRISPPTHPHHQWPGEVQPGAKAQDAGGEDLSQSVSALAVEQAEEWVTGRRYLDVEELRDQRCLEKREAEETMLMQR
jgi:hypothetical protein